MEMPTHLSLPQLSAQPDSPNSDQPPYSGGALDHGHKDSPKIPVKGVWRMGRKRGEMASRKTAAQRQLSIRLIGKSLFLPPFSPFFLDYKI
jgi:hypothetical protein